MQDNRLVVRRFVDEVINKGNLDSAGEFFWEDMVEQVPFPGQQPGLSGLKDVLRGMREAFPDLHFAIEEQNGKIKDTRIIMDTLGLMEQLGVFPPKSP
jgi:predicted ester cyclase